MTYCILIADDEPDIRSIARISLEAAGMQVVEAVDGRAALVALKGQDIDLVVLDIGMPVMGGFECCRAIRAQSRIPILFLTAQSDEIDRIVGFELGGDDYVAKPFSPRELVLRIKAILARGEQVVHGAVSHGDLRLDRLRHSCTLGGADLGLTATEFSVLEMLLSRPGIVADRNKLIEGAYGDNNTLSGRTVDSHVRNIRAKAAVLGYSDIVETVRGVGLRLGSCTRDVAIT
jgi:two-component system, OmpR family, response regulator